MSEGVKRSDPRDNQVKWATAQLQLCPSSGQMWPTCAQVALSLQGLGLPVVTIPASKGRTAPGWVGGEQVPRPHAPHLLDPFHSITCSVKRGSDTFYLESQCLTRGDKSFFEVIYLIALCR